MNKNIFQRYAWGLVGYTVLVILWGAVVRATGSGAGCGSHWPLCNGEVMPELVRIETAIELIHRITSSLAGALVILLVIFAYKLYGAGSRVTRWAFIALVFIIVEGLLGRALVVQGWVEDDVSVMRAVVVAIHLVNTYILLLTLVVTAWLSSKTHILDFRRNRSVNILLICGVILSVLFSAMGAVTALGDTLFPPESIASELQRDFDPASNFLIRLRVVHPVMAVLTSSYLVGVIQFVRRQEYGANVEKRGRILIGVIITQVLAGGFTILTLAPLVMQVLHLLLADLFWISLVLFSLETLTKPKMKSGAI